MSVSLVNDVGSIIVIGDETPQKTPSAARDSNTKSKQGLARINFRDRPSNQRTQQDQLAAEGLLEGSPGSG